MIAGSFSFCSYVVLLGLTLGFTSCKHKSSNSSNVLSDTSSTSSLQGLNFSAVFRAKNGLILGAFDTVYPGQERIKSSDLGPVDGMGFFGDKNGIYLIDTQSLDNPDGGVYFGLTDPSDKKIVTIRYQVDSNGTHSNAAYTIAPNDQYTPLAFFEGTEATQFLELIRNRKIPIVTTKPLRTATNLYQSKQTSDIILLEDSRASRYSLNGKLKNSEVIETIGAEESSFMFEQSRYVLPAFQSNDLTVKVYGQNTITPVDTLVPLESDSEKIVAVMSKYGADMSAFKTPAVTKSLAGSLSRR